MIDRQMGRALRRRERVVGRDTEVHHLRGACLAGEGLAGDAASEGASASSCLPAERMLLELLRSTDCHPNELCGVRLRE